VHGSAMSKGDTPEVLNVNNATIMAIPKRLTR
jgi:hypothetical protein